MYTFVPKARTQDHQRRGDEPPMQIIDHRRKDNRVVSRSVPHEMSALEIVMDQRNELFDNEVGYKRRIKEMENEAIDMAAALEAAVIENKSLKNNMNRGPTRGDVKKLADEKKNLQNVVDKLAEENIELNELLNRVVKRGEEEWKEIFENVRRRQEERYSVIGPFVSRVVGLKKRTVTMHDGPEMNKDMYDKHLNKLESETQSLLNRLKQLKREKRVIDYSLVTGEKKCLINYKEFKEVGANMNRDLKKFSTQLEKLSNKHVDMIDILQESRGLHEVAVQTEAEEKPDPEIVEVNNAKKKPKKSVVERLPPIKPMSRTKTPEASPLENGDISLPAINRDSIIERQRTTIKQTNKAENDKNTTTDASPSSDIQTVPRKKNSIGRRSPVKGGSPLPNKRSKTQIEPMADSMLKRTESYSKENYSAFKNTPGKSTVTKKDSPIALKKDIKEGNENKVEFDNRKPQQSSNVKPSNATSDDFKGRKTLEASKESRTTHMAKMVVNAEVQKSPHR